jgi:hypothetical protein
MTRRIGGRAPQSVDKPGQGAMQGLELIGIKRQLARCWRSRSAWLRQPRFVAPIENDIGILG